LAVWLATAWRYSLEQRTTLLPSDVEATLAHYLLQMAETGWGVGRPELKHMANQLVKLFPEKVDNFKASNSWAQGFMMRHPQCVSRRGQSFEVRRASGLNPKSCRVVPDICAQVCIDIDIKYYNYYCISNINCILKKEKNSNVNANNYLNIITIIYRLQR
jgi:hypothetical protein